MSLAPEFAPEVFIPERARRSARPAQRPVRRGEGADGDGLVLLRPGGPRALTAPSVRPHRVSPPSRRSAPVAAPALVPSELIPSTGWSEPRRVGVAAALREPVTLVLRPAPVPSAALALSAPPLRMTRRGAIVRAGAVALIALGIIVTAWLSAPSSSSAAGDAPGMPAVVTVQAGDTLWSLASRLAPDTDPRAVVSDLRRVNRLDSVILQPGQVLRTR
ncbi:MAG: peptidoglycan-binding protein [Jatrophihabitantaceae bacterium]|nr:peptidoglycan-binding protein [Jatrophihabitantaceae bacterium]